MKHIEEATGLPLRKMASPIQRALGAGILAAGAVAMTARLIGY